MQKTFKIPSHAGITEDQLFTSGKLACSGPMMDLYKAWYQDLGPLHFVWGAGNPETAKVLIIGEAPGPHEDYTGIPFMGPTGAVLSSALHATGISRMDDCFIINSVIQTPLVLPGYPEMKQGISKPRTAEVFRDFVRVLQVVEILKPNLKAIVLLGKYAWVQAAMQERLRTTLAQGGEFDFNGIVLSRFLGWHEGDKDYDPKDFDVPVLVCYHPSYLMYISSGLDEKSKRIKSDFLRSFQELAALIKVNS